MKIDLPFKEIDIPNLDKVITELKNYTKNIHPGLYQAINTDTPFSRLAAEAMWEKQYDVDIGMWRNAYPDVYQDVLEECPTVKESLKEYGEVVNLAFFCLWQKESPIHSDDTVMHLYDQKTRMNPEHKHLYEKFPDFIVRSRINIPLFNCEKSRTVWWEPKEEKTFILNGPIRTYKEHECSKLAEITLSKATILRVDIPHQVVNDGWRFPRLAATLTMDKDLTCYLTKN